MSWNVLSHPAEVEWGGGRRAGVEAQIAFSLAREIERIVLKEGLFKNPFERGKRRYSLSLSLPLPPSISLSSPFLHLSLYSFFLHSPSFLPPSLFSFFTLSLSPSLFLFSLPLSSSLSLSLTKSIYLSIYLSPYTKETSILMCCFYVPYFWLLSHHYVCAMYIHVKGGGVPVA